MNPKVTVLMPVYNAGEYLSGAIDSILKQTFHEFEFLIINDGSTDESLNTLCSYSKKDSRIKIIDQLNSGIVNALNVGLNESRGKWIFRMDQDDIAFSHRISNQLNLLQSNPSLVLLGGCCEQINSNGMTLRINRYPYEHDKLVAALEKKRAFFPHSSACFSRELVLKLGGYRERFNYAEDQDLWLRLSQHGMIGCIDDVVLKLRKHPSGMSNSNSGKRSQLKSILALICYFRLKSGFSDLSICDEDIWQKFSDWAEKKLYKEDFFELIQGWSSIKNAYYYDPAAAQFKKICSVINELKRNHWARKALIKRFSNTDIGKKLFKESLDLF
jgi:glycosyltransferase involved in cell wall biosynthesis